MKRLSNKGFTLIELLATILIIGVVLGLTTYGVISSVNKAKDQSVTLSIKNIKESARTYSGEYTDDTWKKSNTSNNIYFCVTIEELINKGLLDENATSVEDKNIKLNDFIAVTKDNITKVITKEEVLTSSTVNKEAYEYCTGNIKPEDIVKVPSLKNSKTYTDTITSEYEDAVFRTSDNATPNITKRECGYSKTSGGNYTYTDTNSNNCTFSGLKQNDTYYIKVCMTSEYGSVACTNPSKMTTKSVLVPTIAKSTDTSIKITYNDTNIIDGSSLHYFKSSINAVSDRAVVNCSITNEDGSCTGTSTTTIEKDILYKVSDKEVTLTYSQSGTITINAETRDRSDNSKSVTKTFSSYKITFNKGNADTINNQTNNIEKLCIANKGASCNITSPTIEKKNYNILGWNTSSSATSSTWSANTSKSINKDETYYPIVKPQTFTISYNSNGGSGTMSSQTITYGQSATIKANTFTKTGYTFVGWTTNSDGSTDDKYNWTGFSGTWVYGNGQYGIANNQLKLYARWRKNKVTIKFSVNGGTLKSGSTFSVNSNGIIKNNGSDLLMTLSYNDTISSNGLPDYNNTGYVNVVRDGYIGVNNAEWKCLSGNCTNSAYSHTTSTYKASDFCNINNGDCTITLGVNWESYSVVNDYRCNGSDYYYITTCRGTKCNYTRKNCDYVTGTIAWSSLKYCSTETINGERCLGSDTYYITTCTAAICNYTKKNGASASGTVDRCNLKSASSCVTTKTMYINAISGLNCRTGPGSAYDVKTAYSCGLPVKVNKNPTNGWYYVTSDSCYASGDYLVDDISKANCSSGSSGGTSGGSSGSGKGYIAACSCNTNADCGESGTEVKVWCNKSMPSYDKSMPGKYLCNWRPRGAGGVASCLG